MSARTWLPVVSLAVDDSVDPDEVDLSRTLVDAGDQAWCPRAVVKRAADSVDSTST